MSLKINGTNIIVNNASGVEQFNSNDKLVYRKATVTGSATLGGSNSAQVLQALPNVLLNPQKDFSLMYIKVTAGTGNITNTFLNSTIQLNFPLLMHVSYSTTSPAITDYDVISGMINPGEGYSATGFVPYVEFITVSYAKSGGPGYFEENPATTTTISFDWKAVILSYR